MENINRPPLPPFTLETATQKARMAEDAWNAKDSLPPLPVFSILGK